VTVITGASDGIGLGLAERLARAGAELVLPARNLRKGADAVKRIRAGVSRLWTLSEQLAQVTFAAATP
jgi:short-subunit dehydrogenase